MAQAADKKGFKRICAGCSTRFYDFNKRPVICPHCQAEFKAEVKLKTRRGRSSAAANDDEGVKAREEATDETEVAAEKDSDVISLDEAEEMEDAGEEGEEDIVLGDIDADLDIDDDMDDEDDEEEEDEEDED